MEHLVRPHLYQKPRGEEAKWGLRMTGPALWAQVWVLLQTGSLHMPGLSRLPAWSKYNVDESM